MKKLVHTVQMAFLKWQAQRLHDRGDERGYLIAMQQLRALTQKPRGKQGG